MASRFPMRMGWRGLRLGRRRCWRLKLSARSGFLSNSREILNERRYSTQKSSESESGVLPGVVASVAVMQCSFLAADKMGYYVLMAQGIDPSGASSPVSGIPVAILFGAAIRNFILPQNVTKHLEKGLKFSTTTILRTGIVCVGAKLSMAEMATLGATGIPCVVASIAVGVNFVQWLGKRLQMPPKLSSLLAAGTSICGVTAITALAPAIKANQREVSYAVANVVIFGSLGMLVYPHLVHAILEQSEQAGMLLGLCIHDTSQVVAAALTYNEVYQDEVALKMAVVTKLTRNVFLAGVIPLLAHRFVAQEQETAKDGKDGQRRRFLNWETLKKCLPVFVLGFIGVACIRSLGDAMLTADEKALYLFTEEEWKKLSKTIGNTVGGRYLLGTAMAGVGLSTSAAVLKGGGLGIRPFILGGCGALAVGATGLVSILVADKVTHYASRGASAEALPIDARKEDK
mmetsp:Transcript_7163/g.10913  ORF Transcript_7163/g.10913 Transcript_7163/m.10913 type:complete len:459 (+) Transcript_7163:126-1502(+)